MAPSAKFGQHCILASCTAETSAALPMCISREWDGKQSNQDPNRCLTWNVGITSTSLIYFATAVPKINHFHKLSETHTWRVEILALMVPNLTLFYFDPSPQTKELVFRQYLWPQINLDHSIYNSFLYRYVYPSFLITKAINSFRTGTDTHVCSEPCTYSRCTTNVCFLAA